MEASILRRLTAGVVLFVALTWAQEEVHAQSASIDYTPPPAPPVWGDVTRDGLVNLGDLVELGAQWESTATSYEMPNAAVRDQLNDKWGMDVPDALSMLGWNNRPLTTRISNSKIHEKGIVDPSQPKAIGFGISFPAGQTTEKIGLPVFNIPDQNALVSTQFVGLPGGFNDNSSFYNYPIQEAKSELSYIRTYEEEQEFLGVDMSVDARYAIFTGSLKTSSQRSSYREGRTHKLLYKSTKSFGWFYLPNAEDNLTTEFKEDIGRIKDPLEPLGDPSAIVPSRYGTHYVYAEHRVGQLFIEVDFTTSRARDKNAFKLEAEAGIDAATYALNIKAALEQLKQSVKDVSNVRIRIHRVGGTPGLKLPDLSDWEGKAASLDANSENLQADVSALISAWSADMNHYSKGAVDDFFCRPISDFFVKTPVLPWDKGKNLRDWYQRWAEFDDLSDSMYGVLTSPGNVLRNSAFSGNANNWSLGTGWKYENNAIRGTNTSSRVRQTRAGMLTQWTSGAEYDVQITIDNHSQGALYIGTNTAPQQVELDSNGTYVVPIVADAHSDGIVLTGTAFSGVLDGLKVTLKRDFSTPFRHFKLAGPDNGNDVPEQKSSWLQYVSDKRIEVAARKAELLAFGRALYDSGPSDNIIFDPADPQFELADVELPRFRLVFDDNASTGGCRQDIPVAGTSYGGFLQGELLAPGNDYRWMVVRGPGFPNGNCPSSVSRPVRDLYVVPGGGQMTFGFWLDVNVQGSCCEAIEEWQNNRYPGFGIAIIDRKTVPERLVAYGASGQNPDNFAVQLFGVQDAAFISSIRDR